MLKLRFSTPFHKQYMDGKVSVCKYHCTLFDKATKMVIEEFSVTGVAKCSDNDTPNPEFGAKLADSRAKLAAYKKLYNRYPEYRVEELVELVTKAVGILEFQNLMGYLKRKEAAHIKELCKQG